MQHYSISFRCFTYIFYLLIILYHMVLPVENLCNFPVWMNWKINWVLEAYVSLIFISFTWLCLTGTRSLAGRATSAHVYFLKKSLWICGWPFCKVCTQSVCKEISFRVLSIGARWETNKQKKDLHKRETAVSVPPFNSCLVFSVSGTMCSRGRLSHSFVLVYIWIRG